MRVVVVEDEIRIREGIQGLLEMLGYDFVGGADNGNAGLELIRTKEPDVVITDIRMDDMSGLEMLEQLREEGIAVKAVVLSAYSEFSYAKQALKLGVTEYLLKPVSVDEFSKTMQSLQAQIEEERKIQPKTLGTLEQVLSAIFFGQMEPDAELEGYLASRFGLDAKKRLVELCVYLGNNFEENSRKAEKEWVRFLDDGTGLRYCLIRAEHERLLFIVIYQYENLQSLERRIQYGMLRGSANAGWPQSVGWIEADGIGALKKEFETLYQYMDWNLTLGKDILISYPKILQIQTDACVYPIELENRLKSEFCSGNLQGARKMTENFHAYFTGGSIYTPKDIKECYVRFVWAILHITKEIDLLDYGNVSQQAILDQIMGAKLFEELKDTVKELFGKICMKEKEDEEVSHLTVRRIKSMIHEYYKTGITLDEIALKLNVTPEYLSMQFHREVGETYTSYLKNYRVNKAKELLIGTQMKQYEIALDNMK